MTVPKARAGQKLPRLSIIIASRHRRARLAFCLTALTQQDHPDFEVILVADPASINLRPDLPLKRIPFDDANISAARNAGLAAAAGEIVAFIDDDALALPGWAARIAAAFHDPRVMAATGATRGPDGMRWQARAERIGPDGLAFGIHVKQEGAALAPDHAGSISTLGTNCAFRRTALEAIGGFDPIFRYHLDESDVNLRMAGRFPLALTAVLPQAEVIHGAAAGPVRASSGVPSDLRQVGRSSAIFARRHGGTLPDLEALQRKRLLRLMVAGRLDPLHIGPLLAGLREGMAEGRAEGLAQTLAVVPATEASPAPIRQPAAFSPFPYRRAVPPVILSGWIWQARDLRRQARQISEAGGIAGVILWSPGFLPHRLTLSSGGWWEQAGGIWGFAGEQIPLGLFGRRRTAQIRAFSGRLQGFHTDVFDLPAGKDN